MRTTIYAKVWGMGKANEGGNIFIRFFCWWEWCSGVLEHSAGH
ncbi:hypothetical protein [Paenibacillus lautus]|nr:hypothetical protein [Paenibacillus lautus]